MNRFLRSHLSFAQYGLPLIFLVILFAAPANAAPDSPAPASPLYYTSEGGRFNIMMPMPISLHEQTLTYSLDLHQYAQLSGKSLDCHRLAAKDYGAVWFVIYCDYPPEAFSDLTPNQILDRARDSAFTTGIPTLEQETNITYDNRFPGRIFVYQLDAHEVDAQGKAYTNTYKAHAYLADNRLYWIGSVVGAENQNNRLSEIDPFLDSFYIESPT